MFLNHKMIIGWEFYFSLLTVAAILSFASISTQNNLYCTYELRSRANDYIDLLHTKCENKKHGNAAASRSVKNAGFLLTKEANKKKKLESLRVEILPLITRIEILKLTNNKTLPKISQNIQDRITSSEVMQDVHNFHRIFIEVRKANDKVNRVHLNASSFLVSAKQNFNFTHQEKIYFKKKICINRWTVDKIQQNVHNLTEEDCHPSKQNVEIGSNFLLKVVQELSIQDQKLFDKIDESDRKILELESEIRKLKSQS